MNVTTLKKKFLANEKLLKKEEVYLWRKLANECDRVFSIFIRGRDNKKGCITCGWPIQHNAHWISRAWYSHRRDENNCAGACANCNTYNAQEHGMKFTIYQTKTFWQDRVDTQLTIRNKKKPKISELLEIIEKYTKSQPINI